MFDSLRKLTVSPSQIHGTPPIDRLLKLYFIPLLCAHSLGSPLRSGHKTPSPLSIVGEFGVPNITSGCDLPDHKKGGACASLACIAPE
eukprot:366073-Pelagomonas_calceolata.AAC.3